MAKVGEIDVAIRPVAKADILLIAQSFNVNKIDGTLFRTVDTLTSFMERFTELIRTRNENTEELALPMGKMSFAFPTVITEGAVKFCVVNKQKNGMERFLAAPAPLAVEDENFVEAENGNEPVTRAASTPMAVPTAVA
ncbi:MAG: hypothetical protein GY696_35160, partial [Gammaproteobacteria bacterium]|nr:hypothetical protein [Gammaproteobacteria bacterium]